MSAALRILATNVLGATFVPVPTGFGPSGTRAGIDALATARAEGG